MGSTNKVAYTPRQKDHILLMVLDAHENAADGLDPVSLRIQPLMKYPENLTDMGKLTLTVLEGYEPRTKALSAYDRACLLLDVAKSINQPLAGNWQAHCEAYELIGCVAEHIYQRRGNFLPEHLHSILTRLHDTFNAVSRANVDANGCQIPLVIDLNRLLLQNVPVSKPVYSKLLATYADCFDQKGRHALRVIRAAHSPETWQAASRLVMDYITLTINQTRACAKDSAPVHAVVDAWQMLTNGFLTSAPIFLVDYNMILACNLPEGDMLTERAWENIATSIAHYVQASDFNTAELMLNRLRERVSADPADPCNIPEKHRKITALFNEGMASIEAKKFHKVATGLSVPLVNYVSMNFARPAVIRVPSPSEGPQAQG